MEHDQAGVEPEGESWTLGHVTEIVYLATQVQLTKLVEGTLQGAADGDSQALQVRAAAEISLNDGWAVIFLDIPFYLSPLNKNQNNNEKNCVSTPMPHSQVFLPTPEQLAVSSNTNMTLF